MGSVLKKSATHRVWLSLSRAGAPILRKILGRNSKMNDLAGALKIRIDDCFNQQDYSDIGQPDGLEGKLTSKLCTESDFKQKWFSSWCKEIGYQKVNLHRKIWEHIVILQALEERGMFEPGKKGLGFGVGIEPLPAVLAKRHVFVTATDIGSNTDQAQVWEHTGQHSDNVDALVRPWICDPETFRKYVSYRPVDMNKIPEDLVDFDFTWSSCAFEHLGSIQNGLDFIINQMKCLKKGGLAVHTTEFNISSNRETLESDTMSLFRRKDFEKLVMQLTEMGAHVEELDTSVGFTGNDFFVDRPPYRQKTHLKLSLGKYVSTSIVLIIRK
jgi:hypothetical protein